eukprot:CAMPEP_0175924138 /NCGR_PEP_ID=MMETSP0108-20121206/14939_1 /TAXON_ID=195067 ORGANISM="Goniomonas pacifica, Strain CCMP1869" /NCGR_SAMPLE_ID=MMETSP0108 /ASSEMBLY_ACC=CAM_ASM_000204 /LENGTH=341 /DNA_ID=CAMNT_0017247175 /DNA_START=26 /DNA_END=1051 /DNA_ORIENTATION=-
MEGASEQRPSTGAITNQVCFTDDERYIPRCLDDVEGFISETSPSQFQDATEAPQPKQAGAHHGKWRLVTATSRSAAVRMKRHLSRWTQNTCAEAFWMWRETLLSEQRRRKRASLQLRRMWHHRQLLALRAWHTLAKHLRVIRVKVATIAGAGTLESTRMVVAAWRGIVRRETRNDGICQRIRKMLDRRLLLEICGEWRSVAGYDAAVRAEVDLRRHKSALHRFRAAILTKRRDKHKVMVARGKGLSAMGCEVTRTLFFHAWRGEVQNAKTAAALATAAMGADARVVALEKVLAEVQAELRREKEEKEVLQSELECMRRETMRRVAMIKTKMHAPTMQQDSG